jgi:hypothetical protein
VPKTLSDESFSALHAIVGDIDFFCKRLTEWRALGLTTANAESRLDVFLAGLRGAGEVPTAPQLAELVAAWAECDRQIEELSFLPGEYLAITRSLQDGTPDATVRAWLDDIVAAGRQVGVDLAARRFGPADLPAHCAAFKAGFRKLSIQRDAKINVELKLVAALASELKAKFE